MNEELTYYADPKRHLVCVPYSIENLHRMAQDLGIKRHWFHAGKNKAHYDIPLTRKKEILGRVHHVVSPKTIVKITQGKYPEKLDPEKIRLIEYRLEGRAIINKRVVELNK